MSTLDVPKFSYRDAMTAVAPWRSIVFTVWGKRPLTLASVEGQVRATETHGRAVGKGNLVEIVLLDPVVQIPAGPVRELLNASVDRVAPYYACVATLFQGPGVRASMIRGVLTSLQLLSRTPFTQKVFSAPNDCVGFVYPHARRSDPRVSSPAEVLDALAAVRAQARELGIFSP